MTGSGAPRWSIIAAYSSTYPRTQGDRSLPTIDLVRRSVCRNKRRGVSLPIYSNVGYGSSPCENSNGRAAVDEFELVFRPFSASTGSAERKNSLQMRRLQTISEFLHSLGRFETLPWLAAGPPTCGLAQVPPATRNATPRLPCLGLTPGNPIFRPCVAGCAFPPM
jgi:hypothetical protein